MNGIVRACGLLSQLHDVAHSPLDAGAQWRHLIARPEASALFRPLRDPIAAPFKAKSCFTAAAGRIQLGGEASYPLPLFKCSPQHYLLIVLIALFLFFFKTRSLLIGRQGTRAAQAGSACFSFTHRSSHGWLLYTQTCTLAGFPRLTFP
jgi:hypothetical protein